jgi:hypothetical protein
VAASSLKFDAYRISLNKKQGETVTTQPIQTVSYPTSERSQGVQDLLLVSSFGLWAALLGLTPVLAFRLLVGS